MPASVIFNAARNCRHLVSIAALVLLSFGASAQSVPDDDDVMSLISALKPKCSSLSSNPVSPVGVGTTFRLTVSCTRSPTTYTWYRDGVDIGTTTQNFVDTAAPGTLGTFAYKVVARRGLVPSNPLTLSVATNNTAPTISVFAPGSGSIPPNTVYAVTVVTSDRENNVTSATISVNGVSQTVNGGPNFTIPYAFVDPGTYVISVEVRDLFGLKATAASIVTVLNSVAVQPPALTAVGGSTPGTFAVSLTGAATYSIPIAVAPGVNGLAPSISVDYSSQSRDDILGYGWLLKGLSTITRCPQTLAQDNASNAVTLTTADRFCLDGKRLMLTGSGTYGANATEYRTEIDEFSRIVAYELQNCAGCWIGIASFTVQTKSGLTLYYGFDNIKTTSQEAVVRRTWPYTGDTALSWSLFRVEDRRGNYMTIQYDKDGVGAIEQNHRPKRINWVFDSGSPKNWIEFAYDTARPDPLRRYVGGVASPNNRRLTAITSYTDNATVVRQYRINYVTATSTGRSLISDITECDAAIGGTCLPATSFTWTQRAGADNAMVGTPWGGPEVVNLPTTPTSRDLRSRTIVGDFDGDGKADLATSKNGTWTFCFSNGSSFACSPYPGFPTGQSPENLLIGDLNGDGKTDLIVPAPAGLSSQYTICLSTSSGTTPSFSCNPSNSVPGAGSGVGKYLVTDVTGDGRDDIIVDLANGNNFVCSLVVGTSSTLSCSGYGNATQALSDFDVDDATYRQDAFVGDYNGDGRSDVLTLQLSQAPTDVQPKIWMTGIGGFNSGVAVVPNSLGLNSLLDRTWTLAGSIVADINGDGLSDVVFPFNPYQPNYPTTTIYCRSMGGIQGANQGLDCVNLTHQPDPGSTFVGHHVADFDGDGRPDLITGLNPYKICQFVADTDVCADWSRTPAYPATYVGPIYADFNGDGMTDLAIYERSANRWWVYTAATKSQDLLQRVTEGGVNGRWTDVTYAQLSDSTTYTPEFGSAYPQRNVNAGMWIAKATKQDNGVGGSFDNSYKYKGLAADLRGRGSLGFREVASTDAVSNVVTTTTYAQSFPYTGLPTSIVATHQPSVLVSATSNIYATMVTGPGSQFAYLQQGTRDLRDLDNSVISTTVDQFVPHPTFGVFGNPSSISSSVTAGGETYTTTVNISYNDPYGFNLANWVIAQPNQVTVTKTSTSPASSVTRTTQLAYFGPPNYDLQAEVVEPSGSNLVKLTTQFERDGYGNISKRTLTWKDPQGADKQRDVESRNFAFFQGRFPRTVTNAKSQSETRDYDTRTGAIKSLTGIDLLQTLWSYDGFGRRTRELRPDGTSTTTSYQLCAGNDPDCSIAATRVVTQTFKGATQIEVPTQRYFDRLDREVLGVSYSANDGTTKVRAERGYDGLGRLLTVARPHLENEPQVNTTYALYDDFGRVLAVTYPKDALGTTATDGYAYTANTRTTTNDRGGVRMEVVNGLGKLRSVTERITPAPTSTTTSYGYDGFGNLTRITDNGGNQIVIGYDVLGRRTSMNDPDLGSRNYYVDALGQVYSQIDAKAQITSFFYDDLRRMTSRTEGTFTATWTYDTCKPGRLCVATAPNYTRNHYFDGFNRPSLVTINEFNETFTSARVYDDYGRLQSETHSHVPHGPVVIGYGYNGQGRFYQLVGTGVEYWRANLRDGVDHVTKETLGASLAMPNGLVTTRTYHPGSARLNLIQTGPGPAGGSTTQNDSYAWDSQGNVVSRTNKMGGNIAVTETFTYDLLDRMLTSSVSGVGTKSYNYDALGNIQSKTGVGTGNYVYAGPRPHAVTSIPGIGSLVYDNNGNLQNGNGQSITWTAFDMPTAITKGVVTDTFDYGPEHQRIRQQQTPQSTTILYAGSMELNSTSPSTLRTYLPQGVGVVLDDGTSKSTLYFHRDHLGSTSGISNTSGTLVEAFAYDPWGKRRLLTGADGSVAVINDRYGYTSHEMLDNVGLVHMNGRVFDPSIGHFTSADPYISDWHRTQGLNRYAYVRNNPLTLTDPTGFVTDVDIIPGQVNVGPPTSQKPAEDNSRYLSPDSVFLTRGGGGSSRNSTAAIVATGVATRAAYFGVGAGVTLLGRPALAAAVVGLAGYGIYKGGQYILSQSDNNTSGNGGEASAALNGAGAGQQTQGDSSGRVPPPIPQGWKGDTPPAPGWRWEGPDPPGGARGGWVSPDGQESLHADNDHKPPIGAHVDWNDKYGGRWRVFPDGTIKPK